MSQLPLGWCECTVGDLANYVTSGSREWSKYYSNTGALFVRTQDIKTNELCSFDGIARVALPPSVEGKRTRIFKNDLLITITGANVGKCAYVIEDLPEAYVSQSIALVRLLDPSIAQFIHKQLIAPSFQDGRTALQRSAYGLGRPVLNLDNVRTVKLRLPPAREQGRIVAKIDRLRAKCKRAREHLDHIPRLVDKYKQAVLAGGFRGTLTNEWRHVRPLADNYPSEPLPISERLHLLPSGWKWVAAADVVEGGSEIVYGIVQPGPKLISGVPYVRGTDIEDGRIKIDQLLFTSDEIARKYERASLKAGDVLLGIIRATKVAIVPVELTGGNITQGTARFRPSQIIRSKFLARWLESPRAQAWLHSKFRGIDMPGLNLRDVRQLPIPLVPIEEQDEIVRRVETAFAWIDRLAKETSSGRKLIEHLDQAILAKAFRGELVPQDRTDEPASDLLKRIRATKG